MLKLKKPLFLVITVLIFGVVSVTGCTSTDPTAAVIAAIDIIDSTGFHGISEEIEAANSMEDISSRTKGKVENAVTISSAVTWPDELTEVEAAFIADAEGIIEALDSADLEAAKGYSLSAHGTQHDLSHETYEWLASQVGKASGSAAIIAAIDIIDGTGFHDISEEIEAANSMEDISSRTKGKVENAVTISSAVTWPDELTEVEAAFIADAEDIIEALDSADLEAAKGYSLSAHGTQHDLSHETYEWLLK